MINKKKSAFSLKNVINKFQTLKIPIQANLPDDMRVEVALLEVDVRCLFCAQTVEQDKNGNDHACQANQEKSNIPDSEIRRWTVAFVGVEDQTASVQDKQRHVLDGQQNESKTSKTKSRNGLDIFDKRDLLRKVSGDDES